MKSYTQIGSTLKPHGIRGALKCFIEEQYLEDFLKADKIVLETRGTKLPYFVHNIQDGNALILHLKGVNTRDAALVLAAKPLYLSDEDILKEEDREIEVPSSPYAYMEGFVLKNKEGQALGTFSEIREMPAHDMGILEINGQEIMVPLVEAFMVSENVETKEVVMDLPEGLV